jgi:D-tyrosyl-tRNA(Tyr) deacylase
MKIVIQRVNKASVAVKEANEIVGKIGKGLFILLGIKRGDSQKQVDELVEKISKLRIMADENNKMNLSVLDTKSEILFVSQFTLYANTKDGNRPSFIEAEEPKKAKELYEYFVKKLKEKGIKVETGSFGDYMEIEAILDGPVTIVLES